MPFRFPTPDGILGPIHWLYGGKIMSDKVRSALLLLVALLLITVTQKSAQAQTPKRGCNAQKVARMMYDGDLREALVESHTCADYYRSEAGRSDRPENDSSALAISNTGFWLCAEAQLHTMVGEAAQAESSISAAEEWQKKHSLFSEGGIVSKPFVEILAVTKGFFFEKKGDLAAAERFYSEYKPEDASGRLDALSHAAGRLAALSLREGKYDEAASRARQALIGEKVPTAYAVLAAVAERGGDLKAALSSYETALRLMGRERDANEFLPIYFAEREAVISGIERLKRKVQP